MRPVESFHRDSLHSHAMQRVNSRGHKSETRSDLHCSQISRCYRGHRDNFINAFFDECRMVLYYALPISFVDSVCFAASLVGISEVGRLGFKELSALTLGGTFFNLTGLSIVTGIATGMDGIGGQVYGAQQYSALGVLLQRASLVCCLTCLPIYLLWSQTESLLVLMGQAPDVAYMAQTYITLAAPGLMLNAVRLCCRSYFQAQGYVTPITAMTAATMFCSPVFNYTLINKFKMGLSGAALAYVAEESLLLFLSVFFMAWYHFKQPLGQRTWTGLSREAFNGWGAYLEVAVPSMIMVCLDWWVLEIMVLLAGLGANHEDCQMQVAAMGLMFSAFTLMYYFSDGYGCAASTRVSNELGAFRPGAARLACMVSIFLGFVSCLVGCAALYLLHPLWLPLFTSDPQVQQLVTHSLPFVVLSVIGYSTNTVVSGVLRGTTRTEIGMYVNFITLWIVGLPLAWLLGIYLGLASHGLWMAVAGMNVLQGSILFTQVLRFDWSSEAKRSQDMLSLYTPLMEPDDEEAGMKLLPPLGGAEEQGHGCQADVVEQQQVEAGAQQERYKQQQHSRHSSARQSFEASIATILVEDITPQVHTQEGAMHDDKSTSMKRRGEIGTSVPGTVLAASSNFLVSDLLPAELCDDVVVDEALSCSSATSSALLAPPAALMRPPAAAAPGRLSNTLWAFGSFFFSSGPSSSSKPAAGVIAQGFPLQVEPSEAAAPVSTDSASMSAAGPVSDDPASCSDLPAPDPPPPEVIMMSAVTGCSGHGDDHLSAGGPDDGYYEVKVVSESREVVAAQLPGCVDREPENSGLVISSADELPAMSSSALIAGSTAAAVATWSSLPGRVLAVPGQVLATPGWVLRTAWSWAATTTSPSNKVPRGGSKDTAGNTSRPSAKREDVEEQDYCTASDAIKQDPLLLS
ncbi:hypothetical protein CEUSTIGMA_g9720.t1 [Chlamydomonas eustigma]|uniref:Protein DETOXIFICATION n=1 Tax=Chlamydomonas eustigma TaxID=1157962 RepID=A0A250XGT9_9CHLO|nr:hypothetical protein CEUSTIGMA_g9720.t1 [Chlamydomonas eustigma]|eukprot:GAX82291.1 hypothetical protein CEUSTIGMA_g9720.t1 [Chlamydomonas eustigma]